ncbi:MAG: hypothetical protein AAF740_08940 [Bacteroidota bacterium]
MRAIFFSVIFLIGGFLIQAQDNTPYTSQFAYGLNLNSQAGILGGLSVRYSKQIDEKWYHSLSLELVEIKHPKEERLSSLLTGEFFVPGKQNYLYVLRPQYGREYVLFKKAEDRGVQINAIGAIGPTLGLTVPYVIVYDDPQDPREPLRVPFDPNIHAFNFIRGSGLPFESIANSKFHIGGSAKVSAVLEYSASRSNAFGLEIGYMVDAFASRPIIMPLAENRAVFSSIFVTIFYGFNTY